MDCGSEDLPKYGLEKIGPSRNGNLGIFMLFGPNPDTPRPSILWSFLEKLLDISH